MAGTKRVYAPRSASRPPAKKQIVSLGKQLMKFKETKRAVALSSTTPGVNGNYTQVINDYNSVEDSLQGDQGLLIGMNIRATVSATAGISSCMQYVRVLVLKGKRNETITSGTTLWLDAAQANGQAGTSAEVLALEQIVYPINRDGFVCKYDHVFTLATATGTPSGENIRFHQASIKLNEKIEIYDDVNGHSANYYICTYGCESDGTASSALVNVAVELLYKDRV